VIRVEIGQTWTVASNCLSGGVSQFTVQRIDGGIAYGVTEDGAVREFAVTTLARGLRRARLITYADGTEPVPRPERKRRIEKEPIVDRTPKPPRGMSAAERAEWLASSLERP
jgi:hypothetical protein